MIVSSAHVLLIAADTVYAAMERVIVLTDGVEPIVPSVLFARTTVPDTDVARTSLAHAMTDGWVTTARWLLV